MMSLAFSSREVPEGSTVGLHGDVVVSPLAYVSKKRVTSGSQDDDDDGKREGFSCFSPAYYLKKGIIEEDDGNDLSEVIGDSPKRRDNGFCFARDRSEELSELSSESSSIVVAGESDLCTSTTVDAEYDDGEEVESKLKDGALGSLGCLEESLPIKRGLSNNFSGRSKSFANLSDVNTVEDLAKPENPFNKRRRTLMASKWSRKSFYTCLNPTTSMPLLAALNEDEGEDDQLQQDHHHHHHHHHDSDSEDDSAPSLPLPRKNLNNFKSSRCFSLTDLQQQNPDKY